MRIGRALPSWGAVPMLLLASGLALGAGPASSQPYYAERTVWDRFGGGYLNISSFAFRDLNRNGVYDLADQPMAGVMFELVGGGRTITRRTNKSGFGNFTMSVLDRDQDIVNPGEYVFQAVIPPGWVLTTGNARQSSTFVLMPGAPGDLISSTPLQPVGLAQALTISGRIAVPEGEGPAVDDRIVRAVSPRGGEQAVALDPSDRFSFEAAPGSWTLLTGDPDDQGPIERRVEVTSSPVMLATLRPDEQPPAGQERGTVVGFDDVVTAGIKELPAGYRRLDWRHWVATHNKFYDGEGYANTTMSGEFVAYNSSGHPATISRDRPFDFIGGFFGGAWLRAEGETLRIRGWRGATLAYDESVELSSLGPVYLAAGFRDVTRLEFSTARYWQFVADDLAFAFPD